MLFVGQLDARNAQERVQGIKEALTGIEHQHHRRPHRRRGRCASEGNAADTLVRYPDINALVGLWSYNGPAILNAVREAGKVGPRADRHVRRGRRDAGRHQGGRTFTRTVVQQPYEFGYQAITRMAQAVRGDRSFIPDTKQIIVPTLIVNRANVDEFTQRINTLRGR